MTKQQANKEAAKIIDEYIKKAEQIIKEAKQNGTWLSGMDGNNKLFVELRKEMDEKLRRIASMVDKE